MLIRIWKKVGLEPNIQLLTASVCEGNAKTNTEQCKIMEDQKWFGKPEKWRLAWTTAFRVIKFKSRVQKN